MNQSACAHLHVSYRVDELPGGMCRGRWACDDCQHSFMPTLLSAEATPSPAPGPSCAVCGVSMVLRRILRCPACGSTPELTDAPSPATKDSRSEFDAVEFAKQTFALLALGDHVKLHNTTTAILATRFHQAYVLGQTSAAPSPAREETIVRAQRFLDDQGLSRNIVTADRELINLDDLLATFYDAGARSVVVAPQPTDRQHIARILRRCLPFIRELHVDLSPEELEFEASDLEASVENLIEWAGVGALPATPKLRDKESV